MRLSRSRPRAWGAEPIPFADMSLYVRHHWRGDEDDFFEVIEALDDYYLEKANKRG